MPLPVRSYSPIKTNHTAIGASSPRDPRATGRLPRGNFQAAKEPPALTSRSECSREAGHANALQLWDPGVALTLDLGNNSCTVGRSMAAQVPSHSSASDSDAKRTAPVSGETAAGPSYRLQQGAFIRKPVTGTASAPKSHSKTASGATRTAGGAMRARHPYETASQPKNSVSVHAGSPSLPNCSIPLSGKELARSSAKPPLSNLHQQHSPKKASTTHVPLAPVSRTAVVRPGATGQGFASTEHENLQDELLQLRLLHERSADNSRAFEASIRSRLNVEYAEVEKDAARVQLLERQRQIHLNALALGDWLKPEQQAQTDVNTGSNAILHLAHCLKELQYVSKDGGPLDQARTIFDEWCASTASRRSKRGEDDLLDEDNLRGELVDPQWLALGSAMEVQVRACAASLASLQQPPATSSIGAVVSVSRTLADQILQEVEMCMAIAGLILQGERGRLEAAVDGALVEAELHHSAGEPRAGSKSARRGIWTAQ